MLATREAQMTTYLMIKPRMLGGGMHHGLMRRARLGVGWGMSVAIDAACDAPADAAEHTYHARRFRMDERGRRLLPAE